MPTYTYEVLNEQGEVVEIYEAEQSFQEAALTTHPVTGEKLRKILTSPRVNTTYSNWKNKLDDRQLEQRGFTRYEKDPLTGRYNKTNQGAGPSELDPNKGVE